MLPIAFSPIMIWNKINNITHHCPHTNRNRGNASLRRARGVMRANTIYSHTDRFTTIGAALKDAPPGFANADMHARDNWGSKVRDSADGRASLYVREFGNGYQIFTFVIWAQ